MPNTHLPCTANPALLLMAAELFSPERVAQLDRSRFCVTQADTPRDVYLMRDLFHFSVAVFTDTIGYFALRASAQLVRGQWPKARILILGKAPIELEDHLYDETVVHASSGNNLLEILDRISEDPGKQRNDALAGSLDYMSIPPLLRQKRRIQESDPSKVSGLVTGADYARDCRGRTGASTDVLRRSGHLRAVK